MRRLYGALLRLCPASFRAEYGGPMREIFDQRLRDASGSWAALGVCLGACLEIFPSCLRVHADILRQDLRHTARALRRSPGFTATAVVVSALGIGATTAAFSITDHVLIRPLPFRDPDRLVKLWQDQSYRGLSRMELSPGNYRDWKREGTSFESMAAYTGRSVNLAGAGQARRLDGALVTPDLFDVLEARSALGRVFTAEDGEPGAPSTLLLSHALWQSAFAADPAVLGRTIILNDTAFTVVGIMPPSFIFPTRGTELWMPLRFVEENYADRTDTYLQVVGRLSPGVDLETARAQMKQVAARLERAYPKENTRTSATVVRLHHDEVTPRAKLLLTALLAAASCVLLIACTNLASLLLARAASRRRELAVRAALGAGRERLLRQLLTESLVLAAAGGVLGVLIAAAAAPVAARLVPTALPIAATPAVDLRLLAFAALLTALTGVGFGVVPSLRACSGADASDLREGSRTGSGRRAERLRSILVIAQVTVSVALLVASGLLIRALWRVQRVDPGFRSEGVLTLRTSLPMPRYEKTETRARLYERVLSDVRALPGVQSAAYVSFVPMVMRGGIWPVNLEGEPDDPSSARIASLRFVTPGYFETLGIPLRRGRDVAESDVRDVPSVAVVSESFAKTFWPGQDPIGRRFRFAQQQPTVVGIAGDVRIRGLERESEPQVYLAYRQVDDGQTPWYVPKDLVVRSSMEPSALLPELRRIIEKADPRVPVSEVQTLSEILEAETGPRRIQLGVLGAFAAAALLLAGIGIHGLLAFAVSQRTREIGVRIALGAPSREILEMVLRRGILLALAGIGLGTALALGASRAMLALLAGVGPADVVAFAVAAALTIAMTVAGSLVPALRALRVDPVEAMRAE